MGGVGKWGDQFMSNLGLSGRILSQQGGFQVSRREHRGAKGIKKRNTESKGIVHELHYSFYIVYIVNDCNCLNDCRLSMCVNDYRITCTYIIIIGYECVNNLNCV
jgi:hypothetical protein